MKKTILLILLAGFLIALSGCVNISQMSLQELQDYTSKQDSVKAILGSESIQRVQVAPTTSLTQENYNKIAEIQPNCTDKLKAGQEIRIVTYFLQNKEINVIYSPQSNSIACITSTSTQAPQTNQNASQSNNNKASILANCQSRLICDFGAGFNCYGPEYQQALKAKIKECQVNAVFTCEQYLAGQLAFTDTTKVVEKASNTCNTLYTRIYADPNQSMNNTQLNCANSLTNENSVTCTK